MTHSSHSLKKKLPRQLRGKGKNRALNSAGHAEAVSSPLDGLYRKEHPGVPPSAASYIMGVTREDLEKIHSEQGVPDSRESPRYLVSMANDPDGRSVFEEASFVKKLRFASKFSLHFMHILFHGRLWRKKRTMKELAVSADLSGPETKAEALMPPLKKPPLLERD